MNNQQLNIFDWANEPIYILQNIVFPDAESFEIEFKSAQSGLPVDLWKTYSSFANTQGGIIALGIKEVRNSFEIEGLNTNQLEHLQKDFWNLINNRKSISKNILENKDVQICRIKGKNILAINVPVASRTQKPVFLSQNPFGNTYKRNHEGDYTCTDEEVRRMLADADLSFQPDGRLLEHHTMDDFDQGSIRQYKQLFASSKPDHNWLTYSDKEFLIQLGAYKIDRKTKSEGPTVAGMLMFGKNLSILDENCCPKFFPDYREYLSENPQDRWTDRVYPDGTWEANLFQFYRLVWPKISSKLPKPFQLQDGRRVDETPAHEALREAFVNCIVHADYSSPGNIVIESKLDTYLFINPGTLLVTLEQYYLGGISECRNVSLQKMFMMIGSAEKAGSGVSKILAGWRNAHWRRPYLFTKSQPDRLELHLPMISTIPDDTLLELKSLFGEQVDSLGKDELMVLSTCQIEGDINNQRLQFIVDRHKTEITKLLQELCKKGFLVSDNKGRWTTYHLNKERDIVEADDKDIDINTEAGNTGSSKEGSSKEGSSKEGSSKGGSSSIRLQRDELLELIIKLCEDEYKSLEEIASGVRKAPKYLRDKVLPLMIQNGDLIKQFPDNHPGQKYKSNR